MRAAIYARNSVDKGDGNISVNDQTRMCREYAREKRLEVVYEYTDPGVSGWATGNRPQYLAMMRAAEAREFDHLLVMDLSRLSRNPADSNRALDLLEFYKVRVHDTSREIVSDNESFRMLADLDGAASRIQVTAARKQSRYTLKNKAERGEAAGGCPYGYMSVVREDGKKWYAVVPEEAAVVRRIFEEYAAGRGAKTIAYALNADGVPSPGARWDREQRRTDGKWHPSTIVGNHRRAAGIVSNEMYRGVYVWGKSTWVKHPVTGIRKRECLAPERWPRTAAPDLRIVDDLLWQRVRQRQEKMDMRGYAAHGANANARKRALPTVHLFSTLLRCGECGANYVMGSARKYGCSSWINCGPSACKNSRYVSRTLLEDRLLSSLRQELTHGAYVGVWLEEAEEALVEESGRQDSDGLRERVAKLQRRIDRAVAAIMNGADSPTLAEALRAAEMEKSRLEAVLAARAAPEPSRGLEDIVQPAVAALVAMLDDLPARLGDAAVALEARQALSEWMRNIRLIPQPGRGSRPSGNSSTTA